MHSREVPEAPDWTRSVDDRHVIRAILEVVSSQTTISLELTDIVRGQHLVISTDFCEGARQILATPSQSSIVVLTEGTSDVEALSTTLELLYPHLQGYITFPDFSYKPGGGASLVVSTMRAFAAAGIGSRTVALLDNDVAGLEAAGQLAKLNLPGHLAYTLLPTLPIAQAYPTLGPAGTADLDLNGSACALEMYFGEDVLRGTGQSLPPVQWTGYNRKHSRYQGELLDKKRVQDRFRERADRIRETGVLEGDWSGMRAVFETIFAQFSPADTEAERTVVGLKADEPSATDIVPKISAESE